MKERFLDFIDLNDLLNNWNEEQLAFILGVTVYKIKKKAFEQKENKIKPSEEMNLGMNNEWLKSEERKIINYLKL